MTDSSTVRLAHLSDVHLSARPLGWTWRDWLNKRVTGWIHTSWLGRGWKFRDAEHVLGALAAELSDLQRPDCVVFSGDATALGFPAEMARTATVLGVGDPLKPPGFAVPGNHDYYTMAAAASGSFESIFGFWQKGQRIDGQSYPFARRIGNLWLVGVNSSCGHRIPWDATGRVGDAQLRRLTTLLATLGEGLRILVTHYPLCTAAGQPEDSHHRLEDRLELLEVARAGGVSLWLHGHRHESYILQDSKLAPFPIICAGSATQAGRWSYFQYQIDGRHVRATRRSYDPSSKAFREEEKRELDLPA